MHIALTTVAFLSGLLACGVLSAQSYPSKPVRVVIPISPGSGLDIVGRSVAQNLAALWSQPVLVDNRPGAGGTVGTAIVARSAADGYTLLIAGNGHAVNPALYAKLPYDTSRDFIEIAPLAALFQVLVVSPSAGLKTVTELIARAKAKPGEITFASPGTGTGVHFTGEKFRLAAGINVVHVPYKGGPEAMTDVMMGRVTYWIPSIGTALPFIKGGKLLALGVTSPLRSPIMPDVPTIAESGLPGFQHSLWFGMWAPSRTPGSIIEKLERDLARARSGQEVQDQWKALAADPLAMKRMEFATYVRSESEVAMRLAKAANITPQ
jgi:tripartite-type tricarboxylate transporter receptor subunit TctC